MRGRYASERPIAMRGRYASERPIAMRVCCVFGKHLSNLGFVYNELDASSNMEEGETCFLCCSRCGHAWVPSGDGMPKRCPSCHTARWAEGAGKVVCRICGTEYHMSPSSICPVCGASPVRMELCCRRCGYSWVPRSDRTPIRCPSCHSDSWFKDPESAVCRICGHHWIKQVAQPKRCPSCQSLRWDSEGGFNKCQKCGHSWFSKNGDSARRCPSCKTVRWKVRS